MSLPRILVQLDPDPHASVFDAVVAIDAGVDQLLQYHHVQPDNVRRLVHGAMFTRGPKDLAQTAVFVGGSDVTAGERLLAQTVDCFFGPMRVSVLLDANGANTTSAAAVLAAGRHVALHGAEALVLAGTGPVGQRAARLLARAGAQVRIASRSRDRAVEVCDRIRSGIPEARLQAVTSDSLADALANVQVVVAAGAAGITLLPRSAWSACRSLRVLVDLNAVPPLGIEGVEVSDRAVEREGVVCYGAIGVGNTKMKIHRAAIQKLFTRNDLVLDAEEVFAIGQELNL